jgi:hypothetical protein
VFEIAEQLLSMDTETTQPRDLPGRYGRVIRDLERLLDATESMAVVAGGWAVWRHGFAGRVTEDVDVVVPYDRLRALQSAATLCGFIYLVPPEGRWPKLHHRETHIEVDFLPETQFPGTPARPAPIPIGHPSRYQAQLGRLQFVPLSGLIELKLGAGRAKDIADIIELIHQNPQQLLFITDYLADIHPEYARRFELLIQQAADEK